MEQVVLEKPKRTLLELIFTRILPIALVLVFMARLLTHGRVAPGGSIAILQYITLDASPFSKADTVLSIVALWLSYVATLVVVMYPFNKIKTIHNIRTIFRHADI